MNDEADVRDRGSTAVSVPLLVASTTIGAGALWLALATPLLAITVEMLIEPIITQSPTLWNAELFYSMAISNFVPMVLIVVGISLGTRSLMQPPPGLTINRSGTLMGILSGIVVGVGGGAAFVSCLEIGGTFETLMDIATNDALRGPDGQAIAAKTIGLGMRGAAENLAFTPWVFLCASVMLGCAALFGFSGGSPLSVRPKRKVVILSYVIAVLVVVVFSLQLRDASAFVELFYAQVHPSEWAQTFSGSLNKALLGYVMFAGQGSLLWIATLWLVIEQKRTTVQAGGESERNRNGDPK